MTVRFSKRWADDLVGQHGSILGDVDEGDIRDGYINNGFGYIKVASLSTIKGALGLPAGTNLTLPSEFGDIEDVTILGVPMGLAGTYSESEFSDMFHNDIRFQIIGDSLYAVYWPETIKQYITTGESVTAIFDLKFMNGEREYHIEVAPTIDGTNDCGNPVDNPGPTPPPTPSEIIVEAFNDYAASGYGGRVSYDEDGNITGITISQSGTSALFNAADGYDVTRNDAVKDNITGKVYSLSPSASMVSVPANNLVHENHIAANSVDVTGGHLTLQDMINPDTGYGYSFKLEEYQADSIFNVVDNKIAINIEGFNNYLKEINIVPTGRVILSAEYNAAAQEDENIRDTLDNNELVNNSAEDNALKPESNNAGASVLYLFTANPPASAQRSPDPEPEVDNNFSLGFVMGDENSEPEQQPSESLSDTPASNLVDNTGHDDVMNSTGPGSFANSLVNNNSNTSTASGSLSTSTAIDDSSAVTNTISESLKEALKAFGETIAKLDEMLAELKQAGLRDSIKEVEELRSSVISDAMKLISESNDSASGVANASSSVNNSVPDTTPSSPAEPVAIAPTVVSTEITNRSISLQGTDSHGAATKLINLVAGYHFTTDGSELKFTKAGADAIKYLMDNSSANHTISTHLTEKETLSDGSIHTKIIDLKFDSHSVIAEGATIYSLHSEVQTEFENTNSESSYFYSTGFMSAVDDSSSSSSYSSSSSPAFGTANTVDPTGCGMRFGAGDTNLLTDGPIELEGGGRITDCFVDGQLHNTDPQGNIIGNVIVVRQEVPCGSPLVPDFGSLFPSIAADSDPSSQASYSPAFDNLDSGDYSYSPAFVF